jgi:hypothetical protein
VTQYRLKNSTVEAVRYLGQTMDQLPEFVRNYSSFSAMSGLSKTGRNLTGNLLVPHPGGYYTAVHGDWLVLEGTGMIVLRPAQFEERYEAVEDTDVLTFTAQVGSPLAEAAKTLEPVGPAPVASPVVQPVIETAAAPAPAAAPTTGDAPAPLTETTSDASKQ